MKGNRLHTSEVFLLTPLREGRRRVQHSGCDKQRISTHAPAGGATYVACFGTGLKLFLLTPLREGRLVRERAGMSIKIDFYSRPCGRGDPPAAGLYPERNPDFYSRPCGRGDVRTASGGRRRPISTHAPAGGATLQSQTIHSGAYNFYSRPCGRGDSNFPQVRHEVLRQIAER